MTVPLLPRLLLPRPLAVGATTRPPARRRRSSLALLAPALLVLAACGGGAADDPGGAATTAEARASGAATVVGETVTPDPEPASEEEAMAPEQATTAGAGEVPAVLDFSAATVGGGTFEGASLVGQPALLWFWAPWCTVCAREAPEIADVAAEYEGRVRVVGVAGLSGDEAAMAAFVERGGVGELVHVADLDGSMYTRFGVASQYDSVLLTAEGETRLLTGPLPVDRLRAELDALAG